MRNIGERRHVSYILFLNHIFAMALFTYFLLGTNIYSTITIMELREFGNTTRYFETIRMTMLLYSGVTEINFTDDIFL